MNPAPGRRPVGSVKKPSKSVAGVGEPGEEGHGNMLGVNEGDETNKTKWRGSLHVKLQSWEEKGIKRRLCVIIRTCDYIIYIYIQSVTFADVILEMRFI